MKAPCPHVEREQERKRASPDQPPRLPPPPPKRNASPPAPSLQTPRRAREDHVRPASGGTCSGVNPATTRSQAPCLPWTRRRNAQTVRTDIRALRPGRGSSLGRERGAWLEKGKVCGAPPSAPYRRLALPLLVAPRGTPDTSVTDAPPSGGQLTPKRNCVPASQRRLPRAFRLCSEHRFPSS